MCNDNRFDDGHAHAHASTVTNASRSFVNYWKRIQSAFVATVNGPSTSTRSSHEHAADPSPTATTSSHYAEPATPGSPNTRPKRTPKDGSATRGNDPDQYREVERLLNLGLWSQAEEAMRHLFDRRHH